MSNSERMLKWLLSIGALYFLALAMVHMLGIKVPVLFVYYNVPSYGYQDKIIAFLAFGWSLFLFTTSRDPLSNRSQVKAILVAGIGAVSGLTVINQITDFEKLSPGIDPSVFQFETFGLSVYVGLLIYCYFLATRKQDRE
jgi:hypothetical protein